MGVPGRNGGGQSGDGQVWDSVTKLQINSLISLVILGH